MSLGKTYIRLEFENKKELFEFLQRNEVDKKDNSDFEKELNRLAEKSIKEGRAKAKLIPEPTEPVKLSDKDKQALKELGLEGIANLADSAKMETKVLGAGGLNLTLLNIRKIVKENSKQVTELADQLKGGSVEETARNIWTWIKTNTTYTKDKIGVEELRTPARLAADKKGDCDDYSIFSAAVLKELGYNPVFYIAAFHGRKNYGHIYVGIENIVIDGVMNEFNRHPDGITKFMILKLNGDRRIYHRNPQTIKNTNMLIQQLSGMPDQDYTDFVNSEYERLLGLEGLSPEEEDSFNRVKILKLLEGSGHEEILKGIIPLATEVDRGMNIYFDDPELQEQADQFIQEYESLQGLGDIEGLNGLFDRVKKWGKKVINKAKAAHKKRVTKTKAALKKVRQKAKKVTAFVKKVGLAPARGAFLLLLKLNFLKMAEKLYISYLPESTVKQYGVNSADFKKLVGFRQKFERFWTKSGGKASAIKKAVSGRGKKKAKERYGIGALGSASATAAAAASASPIIVFFKRIWNAVKGVFSKIAKGAKKGGKKLIDAVKQKVSNPTEDANTNDISNDKAYDDGGENLKDDGTTSNKSNWLLLLPIAAAAMFLM